MPTWLGDEVRAQKEPVQEKLTSYDQTSHPETWRKPRPTKPLRVSRLSSTFLGMAISGAQDRVKPDRASPVPRSGVAMIVVPQLAVRDKEKPETDCASHCISPNCYYKHYPNTLALVGRSLTIDQGPGSVLFRHAGITAFAGKRSHRLATGLIATGQTATSPIATGRKSGRIM